MMFWKLDQPEEARVAIDARSGRSWSYAELRGDIDRFRSALPRLGRKSLGLLLARNRYECLVVYLAALNERISLILMDAGLNPSLLQQVLDAYAPDWVYTAQHALTFEGYVESPEGLPGLQLRRRAQHLELHDDLALLLNTSGSTGSPKMVRLTLANLEANARSIAQYLGLGPAERAITSLPMAYSYGLSVINSHLSAGATIVLTEDAVLRREFWDAIDQQHCTSMAGVPYTYQLLLQTGLLAKRGRSLKTLTQAGGRLDEKMVQQVLELSKVHDIRFFVMYGQTEATARISYVPPDQLPDKMGSVGIAVPGGALRVEEGSGELIYCGPNVMQGYAERQADLTKGDELGGVLRTGDQARCDQDGYFYITGRLKRFLKLYGKRFNLDEVEWLLTQRLGYAVGCFGSDDLLCVAVEGDQAVDEVRELVCRLYDLPRTAVGISRSDQLPRTSSGKVNYQILMSDSRSTQAMTR